MLMVGLVVHASTTDYNVRDFGAKGDGKTLDHHAINAAIDSCSSVAVAEQSLPSVSIVNRARIILRLSLPRRPQPMVSLPATWMVWRRTM